MSRLTRVWCAALLAVLAITAEAMAVINVRFTPVDLVRGSARILVLRVSRAQGNQVPAEVVEAIRGQAPAGQRLVFGLADGEVDGEEIEKALAGEKSAVALMLLSRTAKDGDEEGLAGSLLIGIRWYAVHGREGQWRLDRDKQDRFAVWAGSAAMLARGAKETLKSAKMNFPVRCDMSWDREMQFGQVKGKVNGCIVADLGGSAGKCVVVLSDGGDRIYRMGSEGRPPSDVTAAMRLTTASKLAAAGDFDGNGRIDLALWDGRAIALAMQTTEGAFAARPGVELTGCVSLGTTKAGLVAGTPAGPVVIDKKQAAPLNAPGDMGDGGACVLADFDGDGREDILQVFERGIVFFGGEGNGRYRMPARTAVDLVSKPRVAACGDYDADGKLDVVVGGADGLALLMRDEQGLWRNATGITGELAYHGNMNRPAIVAGSPADVNADGRAGVVLFYADRQPLAFFNRGFACFGWARELELSQSGNAADAADPFATPAQASESKAAAALGRGQQAGAMVDVDGNGTPDLLAVDREGNVWVMHGRGKRTK